MARASRDVPGIERLGLLICLAAPSAWAATAESAPEAAIEPLGTGYLILLGCVVAAVLGVFWKYYWRWDEEEKKEDES